MRWPRERSVASLPTRGELLTELRRAEFNPERLLSESIEPATQALIDEKRTWLETPKSPINARERHQAIMRVNMALAPLVAARRAELQRQLEQLSRTEHGESILSSRELPFVVHSTERLREFFAG